MQSAHSKRLAQPAARALLPPQTSWIRPLIHFTGLRELLAASFCFVCLTLVVTVVFFFFLLGLKLHLFARPGRLGCARFVSPPLFSPVVPAVEIVDFLIYLH